MKTTFIYALNCPFTGHTRYVGKTRNPEKRVREHILASAREINHRACWIRSVLTKGRTPVLEIIDEVPVEYWQPLEAAYIEFFREQGFDLVNTAPGGENPPSHLGLKRSPEFCARLSEVNTGEKHPMFGRKHTIATRAKMSASHSGEKNHTFGKKRSPETCAKISAKAIGRAAWNKGKQTGQIPWNKGRKKI